MADLTSSELAQHIRVARYVPDEPVRHAIAVAEAIFNRMDGVGGSSWTHAEAVRYHRKWIVENAGEAVYAGMRPTSLPKGRCRWCIAHLHARSHDQPLPEASDLNKILLGKMCRNCAKAKINAVVAHAGYVTRRVNLGRTVEALLASAGAQVVARDSRGRATRIKVTSPVKPKPKSAFRDRSAERLQKITTATAPRGGKTMPASVHSCESCDRQPTTPLDKHLAEGRRLFGEDWS